MASPIVQLSLSYPFFKIAQILFAVLVLGLSAYIVHYSSGSASIMSVVAPTLAIVFAIYHFISRKSPKFSNWIVLLIFECVALALWLITLALWIWWDYIAIEEYIEYYVEDEYSEHYDRKRQEEEEEEYDETYVTWKWATGVYTAALSLCLIQVILYCITLAMLSAGIRKHRNVSRPSDFKDQDSAAGNWQADMK